MDRAPPAATAHQAQAVTDPRVDLDIDQEAAGAVRQPVPAGLPADVAGQLDKIPMPVLVPSDPGLLPGAKLVRGDGWYTLSMNGDGRNVYLQAHSKAVVRPELGKELQDDPAVQAGRVISESHGIHTVSFRRFGVHYSLDLECSAAMADARCASPAHAEALVDGLIVVGGAP